jgi:hypothetical protein
VGVNLARIFGARFEPIATEPCILAAMDMSWMTARTDQRLGAKTNSVIAEAGGGNVPDKRPMESQGRCLDGAPVKVGTNLGASQFELEAGLASIPAHPAGQAAGPEEMQHGPSKETQFQISWKPSTEL